MSYLEEGSSDERPDLSHLAGVVQMFPAGSSDDGKLQQQLVERQRCIVDTLRDLEEEDKRLQEKLHALRVEHRDRLQQEETDKVMSMLRSSGPGSAMARELAQRMKSLLAEGADARLAQERVVDELVDRSQASVQQRVHEIVEPLRLAGEGPLYARRLALVDELEAMESQVAALRGGILGQDCKKIGEEAKAFGFRIGLAAEMRSSLVAPDPPAVSIASSSGSGSLPSVQPTLPTQPTTSAADAKLDRGSLEGMQQQPPKVHSGEDAVFVQSEDGHQQQEALLLQSDAAFGLSTRGLVEKSHLLVTHHLPVPPSPYLPAPPKALLEEADFKPPMRRLFSEKACGSMQDPLSRRLAVRILPLKVPPAPERSLLALETSSDGQPWDTEQAPVGSWTLAHARKKGSSSRAECNLGQGGSAVGEPADGVQSTWRPAEDGSVNALEVAGKPGKIGSWREALSAGIGGGGDAAGEDSDVACAQQLACGSRKGDLVMRIIAPPVPAAPSPSVCRTAIGWRTRQLPPSPRLPLPPFFSQGSTNAPPYLSSAESCSTTPPLVGPDLP